MFDPRGIRTALPALSGRKRLAALFLVVLAALGLIRCRETAESGAEEPAGVVALFDLNNGMLPFPFDYYTTEDSSTLTGLRIDLESIRTPLITEGFAFLQEPGDMFEVLDTLDGFSNYSSIFVGLSGKIDVLSLPRTPEESTAAGSPVFILDLASNERRPIVAEIQTINNKAGEALNLLCVRPRVPLEGGRKYALVLLNGLKAEDGGPLRPSADFEIVRSGKPGNGEKYEKARSMIRPVLELLEASNPPVPRSSVSVVVPFTTQTIIEEMLAAKEAIDAMPPPEIDIDPDGDGTDNVFPPEEYSAMGSFGHLGCVVEGAMDAPDFRHGENGFELDASRAPIVAGVRPVRFLLCLPSEISLAPFPLTIVQHGFHGEKEFIFSFADMLAEDGIATIAIDMVEHGSQGGSPVNLIDVTKPKMMRDNWRQAMLDLVRVAQAARVLETMDFLPLGNPDGKGELTAERMSFFANSLGSFVGIGFLALNEDVLAGILNVGGSGFSDFFGKYIQIRPGAANRLAAMQFMALMQTMLDRADPVNFAFHVRQSPLFGAAKQVLLQEAMQDDLVPHDATASTARAMALPLVRPYVEMIDGIDVVDSPAQGSGVFQFDPATHSFIFDAGENPVSYPAGRRQFVEFVKSYARTGTAVIIDPY